jgi:hypothetical protein
MCQASVASLRAVATVAICDPRRAQMRAWKARSGPGVFAAVQAAWTSNRRIMRLPCLEIRPCCAGSLPD